MCNMCKRAKEEQRQEDRTLKAQIMKSRLDIQTGKARLFKNVDEYIKSLDSE